MTLKLYYNTELGAVIDRNKNTRRIAICIAMQVFHIAIRFLAYRCNPTGQISLECLFLSKGKHFLSNLFHPNDGKNISSVKPTVDKCIVE